MSSTSLQGSLVASAVIIALCSALPYNSSPSSNPPPPLAIPANPAIPTIPAIPVIPANPAIPAIPDGAPEKLVEGESSVHCTVEYSTIWDTKYVEKAHEECETVYEQVCKVESQRLCKEVTKEECHLVKDEVCVQEYKEVCVQEYKTVVEPYTETECVTNYKDDCEYQWEIVGKEKVWAPIEGSCKRNPYDECYDVQKTHSKEVPHSVCQAVPQQKCHHVDRKECHQVPHQACKNEPITKCQDLPKEICHLKHKRVPVRVSKSIPKKVCETVDHGDRDQLQLDFQPVPAVPVLPPLVPVLPDTTIQTPTTLTEILTRSDDAISFGEAASPVAANKSNEFEKLVLLLKNSTINFKE